MGATLSITIIAAVLLTTALVYAAISWFRRGEAVDLGTVSHQWIAEQKFGPSGDTRR